MLKKLFALAAVAVMGISAQAVEVAYDCDYTKVTSWNSWVMGYIPEIVDGELIAKSPDYEFVEVNEDNEYMYADEGWADWREDYFNGSTWKRRPLEYQAGWYQFFLSNGTVQGKKGFDHVLTIECYSPDLADGEEATLNIQSRWSWSEDPIMVDIPVTNQKQKVSAVIHGPGADQFDLIYTTYYEGEVHISSVKVTYEDVNFDIQYDNILTNGDASADWANPNQSYTSAGWENVCVWSSEKATAEPHPCYIEEVDGERVFVVHASEMIEYGWDNQLFITAPHAFSAGDSFKLSFRMKAAKTASAGTQCHKNPGIYLHWAAIGSPEFTTEWTTFSKDVEVNSSMDGMQTIAFNLSDYPEANDYYITDIRWEVPALEQGWYIASDDNYNGLLAAAKTMTYDAEAGGYTAYIGSEESPASWFAISTVKGADADFKKNAIYCYDELQDNEWYDYLTGGYRALQLPEPGIWKIVVDDEAWQFYINMVSSADVPDDPQDPNDPNDPNTDPDVPAVEGYGLSIDNQEVNIGQNSIAVNLDNADAVVAFQFDVEIPAGIELVYDEEEEEYVIEDSDRLTRNHNLTWSYINGKLRVACYSSKNSDIRDNSGALVYLPIVVSDEAQPGDEYVLNIKGIEVTKAEGLERVKLPGSSATLVVADNLVLGDANGDGEVSVTDITYIISSIMEQPRPGFNERAADANCDGEVSITDVTYVVATILSQE